MKHIVLISVAAMFFVASPSFAQQKGASSSEMKTKEVGIDGLTLHYIELGQGTPVVLVHGTLEDYRTWDGQLEAFSKGYRLISYSRRYHYPNEWPKDATDFSVTLHARDLAAFIKALNLPPVHLVGHSYGAFIAFLVARDHPEVIRSLTLGEPPVWPLLKTTPEGNALLSAAITRSIATSEAFKQGNDEEGVRRFVNGVLGDGSYEKIPPAVLKRVMDNVQELKGEAASRDLFPPTTCEDVQKVKAPTLLVDGELSPKVFHLVDDMLERCLLSVERATIPAASHQMEVENPQAFNDTVLAFIAKH
ncbi:pimeloyl-ACP methyl ester carboxylesterase [Bradyrhizobium japonicum USDA 38]|uniref:alpha/beta fold hydrolase n=1 Tax=Bradyrhizobium japonicum TaxID=375 RepID=UPI001364DE36|nr:alpha/beta hydrolase [Bradyrhizobium japonicum]MCS3900183.1 pimeloyl-ACP methyl ester carboxylesterase [Bradyrhizobium japonicum USDA 38]MCS3943237.1 pimeloyl-ACP methyl ester carboxylesterase [Bradyrhizobium japonicum]MCW2224063.1 pimeloyl-ACP methyl ester carboxylesterase [Bradyrhizobium japonicum]MCW2339305.1 pimeloyl-ACP methyl ester carboxylesterase [Bradyrhizobium japonicum]